MISTLLKREEHKNHLIALKKRTTNPKQIIIVGKRRAQKEGIKNTP
tara:strand:- start:53 stop:190 length:138 start_codon:yes stop_codon:yes gene_type:complete